MSFNNDIFHNHFSVYVSSDELPKSTSSKENFQEGVDPDIPVVTVLNNILGKYDSISGSIVTYNTKKNNAERDPNSDFIIDKLDYTNKTKTFYDGAREDVQVMLVNQYNMYMAGLITTATLIVFAILLARE